nr:MAG TPA: protein of unknown function (DUF4969) [Caudoviricetes sp.]
MKLNRKSNHWRWLSCVSLNLLLVLTVTGCATESPILKSEPKPLRLETQFDVSNWERNVENFSNRLEELLTTVEKRYSEHQEVKK